MAIGERAVPTPVELYVIRTQELAIDEIKIFPTACFELYARKNGSSDGNALRTSFLEPEISILKIAVNFSKFLNVRHDSSS
jgi:hypothetical protein